MISFTHLTICILCNLYYFYFYRSNSKRYEQYKIEKKPWPWNGNQQEWVELRKNCFKNLIQNTLIGIMLAYISSSFKMEFRVDKNFPTYFEMISQSIFFALLYDFMFYWSHRVLHHPSIYRFIHKQHHEFNVTISIAAEYAHPIEYVFGNLIPFSAGSAILGNSCHLVTILMWLCVAIHKTSADHCGYRFPWDFYQYLPFWVDSDYHSYHHSVNIGNYSGAFKIWDSLLGTSKNFYHDLRNRTKAWISLFGFLFVTPRVIQGFWPEHIENPKVFYVILMFLTHSLPYLFVNLYYYAIYMQKSPFFEQFKVEQKPWPWEQNSLQWEQQKKKTIRTMILNIILGLVLASISAYFQMNFRIDTEFPSELEIFTQIIIFALVEDLMFYWSHRTLHHPLLYSRIHKQHHEYNITISIAAEYAHPLEYIFGNVVPVLAGATLLGSKCHLITVLLWLALSIHKTLSDHSGYSFPWEVYQYIPYSVDSLYHSAHHSLNTGNYSSTFHLWDIIGSTKIKTDKKII